MNREINFLNKIRLGYEKKYNSFRIRYTILDKLENSMSIINNLKLLSKPIYIYGNGVIGKKLFNIINGVSELHVLGFIEGKNRTQFEEKLDENAIVIVTPVFDYDKIVELLCNQISKTNILCLNDLFNELE
jgi:hypothetical protein